MRADRLLAIIMYLQTNKRMTARALSRELQVAERTIYRDIIALSSAGIPVYATKGPKGGFSLIEDFKTTLTGLTEEELKTLFMLDIPPQLVQLGLDQKAKLALLKLSAALPVSNTPQINLLDRKFFIDPHPWYRKVTALPVLQVIHQALWQDHRLKIIYQLPFDVTREWVVEPYGLVAKEDNWYLVCKVKGRSMRALPVSRILEAQVLDASFTRSHAFDLEKFWKTYCLDFEKKHQSYPVLMRVREASLPGFIKDRPAEILEGDTLNRDEGWILLTINFDNLEEARKRIIVYGNAIQVIEPETLRLSILDYAQQIVHQYK